MQDNWPDLSKVYDERFRRMFEYYLLAFAGAFRSGNIQLWQMVFSKMGKVMDYRGPR
jgi:cyclopropane-fatty-acyl-phospholipid synthase